MLGFIGAVIVLAMNRGQKISEVEVAAADTGKDYQIIYDTADQGTKLERQSHFEVLMQVLARRP